MPRGLTRERIRLEVVGRFEGGAKNREISAALRVSERSVERWRRQWRERGEEGVRPKGSPGRPRLRQTKSLNRSGSWNAARQPMAGRTSGGRWPG
ncbi:helix-turn-helix domain-containing protein [Streptomyces sp. JV185]|nr:helix-turn-helix domain-containing protein [Streptomyces sp. JV185]MEE1767971.1 helix-turn-helix domain-containing protein [Streptomyces sp. JV185]